MSLTQTKLKELLHYDPCTGVFVWLKSRNDVVTGKVAGTKGRNGYLDIKIEGVRYYAHRLAWLYMTGAMPVGVIDHIDRCKTRNVFSNLRDASIAENTTNQVRAQRNSATGVRGVLPYVGGFAAQIHVSGKSKHLGVFKTIEAAEAAYLAAKNEHAPLPKETS